MKNIELNNAWGEFLRQFPWDWFATMTIREGIPRNVAAGKFNRFARDVAEAAGLPVGWFRGEELTFAGHVHFHALFTNTAHLRHSYWQDIWNRRAGFARILQYDPRKGATYYVTKYVGTEFAEWDLSDDLVAFRHYQPRLLPGPVQ